MPRKEGACGQGLKAHEDQADTEIPYGTTQEATKVHDEGK